jgi:hypothetical protein
MINLAKRMLCPTVKRGETTSYQRSAKLYSKVILDIDVLCQDAVK